jgi:RNA recognition motif-containing protein
MNLFISNIDYKIDENELKSIFEKFGKVKSIKILVDPESNKSLCYGFVKIGSEYEGQKAIIRLNNKLFRKRKLSVQEARPKPPKINPNQVSESNLSKAVESKTITKRKRRRMIVD